METFRHLAKCRDNPEGISPKSPAHAQEKLEKIEDVPSYDPLWGYNTTEKYCYASFFYKLRENYIPPLYKDREATQHITSNMPRVVTDLPYLRYFIAERLHFSHESIWGIKKLSWNTHVKEKK